MAYPTRQLYEEIAFIAFHFHWPVHELMDMEHADRRRWCREISKINTELNAQAAGPATASSLFDVARVGEP